MRTDININSRTYITTREAAGLLGVSVRTVQLWLDTGKLDGWKTDGGHRRVLVESINHCVRDNNGSDVRFVPDPPRQDGGFAKRRLKILVIDDNKSLLNICRLKMAAWDLPCDVVTVDNPIDGLLLIGSERPDVVMTELISASYNCVPMIRALRASPLCSSLRIVVVTAIARRNFEELGGVPENVSVFEKPLDFDALRQHLVGIF